MRPDSFTVLPPVSGSCSRLASTVAFWPQDHPLPASLRSLQIGVDPAPARVPMSLPRLTPPWLAGDRQGLPAGDFDLLRAAEQDPRRAGHNALAEHRDGE